jgi:5-methylcytosine-specific restriction endonuclease McrA
MPTAALRPCLSQPCAALVKRGRCPEHSKVREQQRRPAWITKFYSSKPWQNARNFKRRQNPVCEDCLETWERVGHGTITPTQVVDHVLPLATHPHLKLVLSNLRSLCNEHHSLKTKGHA